MATKAEEAKVRLEPKLLHGANKSHEILTQTHVQGSAAIHYSQGEVGCCPSSAQHAAILAACSGRNNVCVIVSSFKHQFVELETLNYILILFARNGSYTGS